MKRMLLLICITAISLQNVAAQDQWPAITQVAKPWTRWWWMGSAVDTANINMQLDEFKKAGIGGVAIVPIYGAIGYESSYIKYLSPQWMRMLDHTVQHSKSLNMGVNMAVGTGWPIGGPQVSIADAATRLLMQTYTLHANETLSKRITIDDVKQKQTARLVALTAYNDNGDIEVITDKVSPDGSLNWKPATGNWTLYAAFTGKTKQLVKRAAPGGEGYTLDHFSADALPQYLKSFDTAFGRSAHGVKAFYNDSYEVYNADWTPGFFEAFQKRRGYDLRLYTRELASKDTAEIIGRVKSDYRETIADLMRDIFTSQFTKWSHSKGALSLNQAHGSPGNLLDLYAAVDIPETETFGSSAFAIPGIRRDSADIRNVDPDPIMLKFASSAAHAMGNKLVSCETFTWLTEHFKTSWSQCKPEVEQIFLAGVNHVSFHGSTYSPALVPWPGWLFYASVNFVPNNSLWPHLRGMNDYISRCQSVLQAGQPDNEILAYWPVYDAWDNPKGLDMPLKVHDVDEWLHPTSFYSNVKVLQEKGYSIDFVSDKMLEQANIYDKNIRVSPKGAAHKILLVATTKYMPPATFKNIIRLATEGATVIMQQLPADVPGLYMLEKRKQQLQSLVASLSFIGKENGLKESIVGKGKIILSEDVQQALGFAGIKREALATAGLKFIRRVVDGGKYYYVINHDSKPVDQMILLNTRAATALILDPLNGATGMASFKTVSTGTDVRIQLKPGQSVIVKLVNKKVTANPWKYIDDTAPPVELNNEWKLHFTEGGPALPTDKIMKTPVPWTSFYSDTATQNFSGTGVYSSTFSLPVDKVTDYILKLDKVYESARIIINGQDAGIAWSIPFELRIGKYLRPGKNTIAIEVCNLMANRIRFMDRHKMEWRKYHEINFVNINYKNFDATNWVVQPSGLEGNITIVSLN